MSVQLGNLKLKNRIFLAPMHQVNDIAFRMLCKKAGAGLTYTGLINPQTREKLNFKDKPIVQFACNSSKGIKEFIKKYDKKVSGYDFNLGCPSPHAKKSKIGYFMINDLKKIEEILKEIKKLTKKPLMIKIRKMSEEQTKKILNIAERHCQAIEVHPRTQEQGYSGIPDVEFVIKIKKKTKLPIIYSGNINTKEEAKKMLEEFDFIMIGRKAIGNPNIFAEIIGKNPIKADFFEWLKIAKKEIFPLYFSQIKFQAINFTKGKEGSSKLRERISKTKTEKEVISLLSNNSI